MRAQIEIRQLAARYKLALGLIGAVWLASCSEPNVLTVPASKLQVKTFGEQERVNQVGAKEGDATGEPSMLQPEADPFLSGEVNSETLLQLASLSNTAVSQLSTQDVSLSTDTWRCGFVATDADIMQKLTGGVEGAGWAMPQQGNMFSPASTTEVMSFDDCRCRVRKLADQRRIYLVPVNTK
jgi:hypothetical protein